MVMSGFYIPLLLPQNCITGLSVFSVKLLLYHVVVMIVIDDNHHNHKLDSIRLSRLLLIIKNVIHHFVQ
jgi:hypothetical protein